MLAALHQRAGAVEGVEDVDEAGVERREAEAHHVGRAEVWQHPGALDQRAADPPALGVGERDVPAAAGGVARRVEAKAERREPRVVQLDRERGQRPGLVGDPGDARLGDQLERGLHGHQPRDVGRSGQEAATPGSGS